MMSRSRIKTCWCNSRWLCFLLLAFAAPSVNAQLNVFFPDTIKTDTVTITPADSFVTAADTGINHRAGWELGPVGMPHRVHEKWGVTCITCHHRKNNDERIKQCAHCHKGIAGMENLHNKCGQCHLYRAMDMTCSKCHSVPQKTMGGQLKKIKFSHVKHYARQKDCKFCHGEPPRQAWLSGNNYPAMKTCLTCHDDRKSSGQCAVCHNDVAQLKPASHDYRWVGRYGHGLEANYNKQECLQCHAKRECDQCHLGQTSCRVHPPGYRYTHGLDVRMGIVNCAMCHDTRQSCSKCHENRYGIQ
ncbi:MAG TPA: cytochrome c3 family protein [Chitinivibrionales bacterium]|nr:cytochrome c3 family protein [Chitinivibrionales bacterium]